MSQRDEFEVVEGNDRKLQEKLEAAPTLSSQRTAALRLLNRGNFAEAQVLLRSAIHTARRERNALIEEKALEDLAYAVLHYSPNCAQQILSGFKARPQSFRSLNLLGIIYHESCELAKADQLFEEALSRARRDDDDQYALYILNNISGLEYDKGSYKLSYTLNVECLEGLGSTGDVVGAAIVLCNMAGHEMIRGNYEEALRLLEARGKDLEVPDNNWVVSHSELVRGEIESVTGDRDKAIDHFSMAYSHARAASDAAMQAKALAWKSVLCEKQGGRSLARDLEGAAHDLFSRGLRSDGAFLLLMASKIAEVQGHEGARWAAMANEVLGEIPLSKNLASHYERVVRVNKIPRRSVSEGPLREFVTQSSEVVDLKERVSRLAATDVRLLIEGESGTGKSYLAQLIHQEDRAKQGVLVVVDCTNLERNLFESKLFGHVRGAFTGAVSNSTGLVEQADGGTLFLDEIGELPLEIQAKLLYTIEEQRFRPVGAKMERSADFRVIAATNKDIDEMLENGTLRRDLYFRVAGYRVRLPALRERREDIVPLVELQLDRLNRRYKRKKILRPGVWEILTRYDWPGNVRELNAALERGFHLSQGRRIGAEDLGLVVSEEEGLEDLSWDRIRRDHLLKVLRLCRANVTRAAKILQMNRTTLIYKLKQLGIDRTDFDPSHEDADSTEENKEVDEDGEAADAPSLRLVADRKPEKAPDEGTDGAE